MLKNIIHEIGLKENRVYIIGKSEGVCYNYTEVKRRMLSMKNVIDDKNPLIREKSKEVSLPLSDDDRLTLMEMYQYLVDSQDEEKAEKYDLRPGVGIAAIQIGIPKRMCAIYIPSVDEEGHIVKCDQWALVNPRIVANAVKVAYLKNGEGCLSVPEDQPGIVPRSAKVTVKGYDALTDQEVTIVARGFTAICLQHELDHFEGILYYDHFNKEDPKAPIPNAMVIE